MTLPSERHTAAAQLASVAKHRRGHLVRLPVAWAKAAVERLLEMHHARAEVLEAPAAGLAPGRWAIRIAPEVGAPLGLVGPSRADGAMRVFEYEHAMVMLAARDAARLLRALEEVKPEVLDARGLPLPWVAPRPAIEDLGGRAADEDDAIEVTGLAPESTAATAPESTATSAEGTPLAPELARAVMAAYPQLLAAAGFEAATPLHLARAPTHRLGFVTGRVFHDPTYRPLRIVLSACPNADLAELLATLAHELAHPASRTRGHGLAFKTTLVELAERTWGVRWFGPARAHLGASYRRVDAWLTCGIRAALRGSEPPIARAFEGDQQLARIVMKVKKLRDLAADQLGKPEGIVATATANELVTTWQLEGFAFDGATHEQLVDAWVALPDAAQWRKTLAHAVAAYCDVFSLAMAKAQRMHFFGRHGDVVTAEYLFSVSAARIDRECAEHLDGWRVRARARGPITAGDTLREKTSFCDSAAIAFKHKLEALTAEDCPRGRGPDEDALDRAEDFARAEHDKRGQSWGSGGRRRYRDNAAGRALGGAMEVLRGVGDPTRAAALPHRPRP